jgi:hypothetical protein
VAVSALDEMRRGEEGGGGRETEGSDRDREDEREDESNSEKGGMRGRERERERNLRRIGPERQPTDYARRPAGQGKVSHPPPQACCGFPPLAVLRRPSAMRTHTVTYVSAHARTHARTHAHAHAHYSLASTAIAALPRPSYSSPGEGLITGKEGGEQGKRGTVGA